MTKATTFPKLAYTVEEVQEILRMSRTGVYAAVREGRLPNVKIGKRRIFPVDQIHALMGVVGNAKDVA